MKHDYFKGIDFDNLPTFAEATSNMTPFDQVHKKVCEYLIEKYSNAHK
jgi:hypothetical protein